MNILMNSPSLTCELIIYQAQLNIFHGNTKKQLKLHAALGAFAPKFSEIASKLGNIAGSLEAVEPSDPSEAFWLEIP